MKNRNGAAMSVGQYDNIPNLAKPKPKTAGQLLDEGASKPQYTAKDLGYMTPLGDLIYVQPREAAKRSPGGILLPDEQQPVPTTGVVVAVGPGQHTITGAFVANVLQVGDHVKFSPQAFGGGMTLGECFVLCMREADVFGVVRRPDGEPSVL